MDIIFAAQTLMMNKVTVFKWVANLEGVSFLILLLVAMPLKYIWEQPWLTQQVGMAHGVLFVGYIIAVFVVQKDLAWSYRQIMLAIILSFIPFGTFYVTAKMMERAY